MLWPRLRTEAAMAIGDEPMLPAVTVDDIVAEARRWSRPAARAREVAEQTLTDVVAALDRGVVTDGTRLADTIRGRVAALLGG